MSFEYDLFIENFSQISFNSSEVFGNSFPEGDGNKEKPAPKNKFMPFLNFCKKIFSLFIFILFSPFNVLNDNLEATAQAIYKSWFIDCEQFELDNEGSPIGWIKTALDKKLTTSTQSINPQKLKEEYVWHYSIPAYDNEHLPTLDIPSSILSNKYLVLDNAILVSKLNPDTKRIWRTLSFFEDAICSTEFIVFSPKIPRHRAFYYLMFNSKSFIDFLVSNATGSTNSRMRVKPASSLDYEFLCPDNSVIDNFCDMVEPLLVEIEKNTLEIRKLNELIPVAVAKMMTSSR